MQSVVNDTPEVAALPGVTFRHTLGAADVDAFYEVHTGRMVQDRLDPFATDRELPRRIDVAEMLAETEAAGRQDRVLAAEVEGQVVGYCRVTGWGELDGMRVYLLPGWVLPKCRGRGIGTAMLGWAERRARRAAAADHPSDQFEFAANASSTEPEATALLLNSGYYVAYTVLEMEWVPGRLDAAPLPSGFALKPALRSHLQQIAQSVHDCYLDSWPGGRYSEELDVPEYMEGLAGVEHDLALWRVAWAGDRVAGQVLCKIVDNRAEVFEVSVRHEWRRRGLARALLTSAMQTLVEREVDAIRLHTVAEFATRARDLYASMGFEVLKEHRRYRKPA